uniref:Uncharacterized protein n=1 Tax=Photinus pyralis TaxID=7054 RepID=A0A1Y1K9R3_PHOPY
MPVSGKQQDEINALLNDKIKELFTSETFLNEVVKGVSSLILQDLDAELEQITKKVEVLEEENKDLRKMNANLNIAIDNMEQYSRRNCLKVFGLPETPQENTDEVLLDLFKNHMHLSISPSDIDRSHRTGRMDSIQTRSNSKVKCRPIIVKFTSYNAREKVFKNKKLLKSSGVIIRENLTQLRANVLKSAINKFNYKNVWTYDGKIFIKLKNKLYVVTSSEELDKIKE